MNDLEFLAYISEEVAGKSNTRNVKKIKISDLKENEVLIKVHYSTLNYKDGLSARGHKGITRNYPHIPGVDLAGEVVSSKGTKFQVGQRVMATGYDIGMNTWGGFSQYAYLPESWLVPLPNEISYNKAMVYGTAGLTAAISINEILHNGINPNKGKVLVTGSTGGVGYEAVGMLSKIGFDVVASTGKLEKHKMLYELGAKEIVSRQEVRDTSEKPLLDRKYASVIDTVGGFTLSTAIRSCDYHGVVAALGLVESDKLDLTVYPFLLRGIKLIGIDSAEKPIELKEYLWSKIWNEWQNPAIENFVKEIDIHQIDEEVERILQGGQAGKVVINLIESK
jgi:acrylyl-CoA reductase (NADPH)